MKNITLFLNPENRALPHTHTLNNALQFNILINTINMIAPLFFCQIMLN
jgi:hypothetical protein